jgi:hypothetical protein
MTANGDVYTALDEAFRAAWFLMGSSEAAENAALDGIAALDFGRIADHVLLIETVTSAMRRRDDLSSRSERASSCLPWELQRLSLLAPSSRDCLVLRVLLGITVGSCSGILHLGIEEFEETLFAALQELPRLETRSSTQCDGPGSFTACSTTDEKPIDRKVD